MNKRSKIALFSLLALIAAFGLMFAGCENPVQEVEGTVGLKANKLPAPGSITATEAGTDVVITYTAVADATQYSFYVKKADSVIVQNVTSNLYGATPVITGNSVAITVAKTALGITTAGTYQIGIQTTQTITSGGMDLPSEVKWTSVTTTS